jgi:Zn-dependent protease
VHGVVRLLEPDGREYRREEWRAGRRHGTATSIDPDGAREEVEFVDGRLEGEHRVVLADGTIVVREEFSNDLLHGESREYDEAGRLRVRRSFHRGVPHGEWVLQDERGTTLSARRWFHGTAHGRHRLRGRDVGEWTYGVRTAGAFLWTDGADAFGFPLWRVLVFAVVVAGALAVAPGAAATLIALGLAIAVHEFGHLLAARSAGIPITEFRVGFGPRICSFQHGATFVDVRAIPLFGFVQPASVRPSALPHVLRALGRPTSAVGDVDPAEEPVPAPALTPPGRRVVFQLGGVAANLLVAIVVRWLAVTPAAPHRAVGWVLSRSAEVFARVPEFFGSLLLPGTYTGGEGGLIAAGHEHIHGLGAALRMFLVVNVVLAAFNVFPIPPLDGFHVVDSGSEALLGRGRTDLVLRPFRFLGVIVFGVLVIGGLWFIGRDLFSILTD